MQGTKWALGFVMLVFGLLITTQIRVAQRSPEPSPQRAEAAILELQTEREQRKAAEKERDALLKEIQNLRKEVGPDFALIPRMDLKRLELMAGTTAISGPGVIVTLSEAKETTAKTRVADEDLWRVTNELLAAGAEGLAIGGERLVVLSGIRQVGQRIMVYQTSVSAPIEIAAIGDPAVLEASLRLRGGVIDTLERWGVKATLARSDNIQLPAFRTSLPFRFAQPVK